MPDGVRLESLSIRSDPTLIRGARLWISDFARSAGMDETEAHDLAVALSEVCSNSHRHSYGGRTDGRIDLKAEAGADHLRLTIRDYGVSFDPSTYRAPELTQPAEGGYGIFLIRSLMDEVEYTNMSVGTQVVLVKSRCRSRASR